MVCRDVSFTGFCGFLYICLFVGHVAKEVDKVWQQVFQVVRMGQNLINRALQYIIFKLGELWPKGSPWVTKIHKWVKKNFPHTLFG